MLKRERTAYSRFGDDMAKLIAIKVLRNLMIVLLAATMLFAVNSWATCPYDGEQANYDGLQRNDGKDCEYRHMHMVPRQRPH